MALSGIQQMAAKLLADVVKNLPPEIMANIDNIRQIILAFAARSERIEAKLDFLISTMPAELRAQAPYQKGAENAQSQITGSRDDGNSAPVA